MNELKIINGLNNIGDMLVDALIDEFVKQGHNNTGAGVESIVYAVQVFGGVFELNLYFDKYLIYQDKGVKPERIPFTHGSGKRQSKYIDALTQWVQQRGMATGQKEARSIAFAIGNKHKKEGMPTKGAYANSLNGQRTGFFTNNEIFGKVPDMVEELIGEWAFAVMDDAINLKQSLIQNKRAA